MKVYEKVNLLKDTNATMEQISDWAYENKICPVMFEDGLELNKEYPKELHEIAEICCEENSCGADCLNKFLNSEVKEGQTNE